MRVRNTFDPPTKHNAPVFSSRSATAPHMTISASFLAVSMSFLGSLTCTGFSQDGR